LLDVDNKIINKDLFGNDIVPDVLLRDKFQEPPFSVLDAKSGSWQKRKNHWKNIGIKSEIGRTAKGGNTFNSLSINPRKIEYANKFSNVGDTASIFDPVLTELMYKWFCPVGGKILDPFAGGSVRGIVAHYLGYKYIGIELRKEQVESNREQALDILPAGNQPKWYIGDSDKILDINNEQNFKFDFIFSCPPYVDLEVYSEMPEDLSNMCYNDFYTKYYSIIGKSLKLLDNGGYAVFVVGEVRDKDGYYYNFVGDTKSAFIQQGAKLYNDAILTNAIGTASMRTKFFKDNKKLVKIHQNVLCFKKI